MKIKNLQNKDGRRLIKVSLTKKDTFDYATASQLTANNRPYLLSFTFRGDEVKPDLYYDTTACVSLETFYGSKISRQQFVSVVRQLIAALDAIGVSSLSERNLLLSSQYVFVDLEDSSVKLVYLPLLGREADDRAALNLLQAFAANSHFTSDDDSVFAQSLLSFLRAQNVFSVIAIKAYFGEDDAKQERKPLAPSNVPARPKTIGRDFVSEISGSHSRTQKAEQRSTSENILAAVSEDFELTSFSGTGQASAPLPSSQQHFPPPSGEPLVSVFSGLSFPPPSGDPVVPAPTLSQFTPTLDEPAVLAAAPPDEQPPIIEAGTTFLSDWSAALNEESANTLTRPPHTNKQFSLTRSSDDMTWKLPHGQTIVGRSKTCDIKVSDSSKVSRQHAIITTDEQTLFICDKNSSNGTFVDDKRIESEHLTIVPDGSVVRLGNESFSIVCSS